MFYNNREKSIELLTLEELHPRMEFSKEEEQHFLHLQKGFEGEVLFDQHLEHVSSDCLILRDLLFKINGRIIQIDTLPIFHDTIYLFEVKNFEGNHYYDDGKIYKFPNYEINNPLHQLERHEHYFKQLLKQLGYQFELKAYVVFVNPTFTLYQAPLNKPFIFPTQIQSILHRLNTHSEKLNRKHKALADKLLSLTLDDSPFKEVPDYDYNSLQKGIICKQCRGLSISVVGKNCLCGDCGKMENVEEAVLRSVKGFRLLFPEEKLTTKRIVEWCGGLLPRKTIKRILEKNFKKIPLNRWTYFI